MPAQIMQAFLANLIVAVRVAPQKWMLWQRPLTEVHQIFNHKNFFVGGVNTTIRVKIRAFVLE